jgi:hypothetical protein
MFGNFKFFRYPTHAQYSAMVDFILTEWPHLGEEDDLSFADIRVNINNKYYNIRLTDFSLKCF